MSKFGRERVENELEWRYEIPKLLAAYALLFRVINCVALRLAISRLRRMVGLCLLFDLVIFNHIHG